MYLLLAQFQVQNDLNVKQGFYPNWFHDIFKSFHKSDTKKVLDRYLTMSIEFSNHNVNTLHSWEEGKKTLFTDFTFFSQRVPLWATTESKLRLYWAAFLAVHTGQTDGGNVVRTRAEYSETLAEKSSKQSGIYL